MSIANGAALELHIESVVHETADAVSLVFRQRFDYQPGQFLTLLIPRDNGTVQRCYSFSAASGGQPRITVKRTAHGHASNWLCDNATPGMALSAHKPAGLFVPKRWDTDFTLLAAGSGITPVMSILETALARHRNTVTLIYANRDPNSTIFADALATLAHKHPRRLTLRHWWESTSGLPTADGLRALGHNPRGTEAFVCGPGAFMTIAQDYLRGCGVAAERIHTEAFTVDGAAAPPVGVAAAAPEGGATTDTTVDIDGDQHRFAWPRASTLLDTLLSKGIDVPYVCQEGTCGACAYTLTAGEVQLRANHTLDDYELGKGMRLACQSLPVSDSVALVFD
jgi:3-ketosteroid 9alpha-monooxygenase subunit B